MPGLSAQSLVLPYRPPYAWDHTIRFLGARAIPGVERVNNAGYERTITHEGAPGTILVRPHERQAALVLEISPPFAGTEAIAARVRRLFDLDADPVAIRAHLSRDPFMARLVASRPGLRVPGAWDAFELAVRAILGQQISVAAATVLAGKLVTLCGTELATAGGAGPSRIFPTPEQITSAGDLGLALGMPRRRAAAITGLAARAAADPNLFEPDSDLEQTVARLCRLPGIGAWTAHYIAMRACRAQDAFPAADIGLLRALATPTGRPTPAELLIRAEVWRPWRAYATLHLWAHDTGNRSPGAVECTSLAVSGPLQ